MVGKDINVLTATSISRSPNVTIMMSCFINTSTKSKLTHSWRNNTNAALKLSSGASNKAA